MSGRGVLQSWNTWMPWGNFYGPLLDLERLDVFIYLGHLMSLMYDDVLDIWMNLGQLRLRRDGPSSPGCSGRWMQPHMYAAHFIISLWKVYCSMAVKHGVFHHRLKFSGGFKYLGRFLYDWHDAEVVTRWVLDVPWFGGSIMGDEVFLISNYIGKRRQTISN